MCRIRQEHPIELRSNHCPSCPEDPRTKTDFLTMAFKTADELTVHNPLGIAEVLPPVLMLLGPFFCG